jgi:heat shock protein HtpX
VFSAGLGLRMRMYVALALNAVLLVALLAGLIALFFVDNGWSIVVLIAAFAFIGAFGERRRKERRRSSKRMDLERARRAVGRLSVLADVPVPAVKGERIGPPLSWTTALPRRQPNIHVTRALLLQLDDAQLEAVLAHELSHIANRDAIVMTVLSAPGIYVLRGLRLSWHDAGLRAKAGLLMFGFMLILPAAISAGLARIVSRHRELAADRGAAMLTGSPAALAAALLRLSGEMAAIPQRDLRTVAARDLLHVVPVRPERGIRRLWATHPRLATRVRELERLESRLQARG